MRPLALANKTKKERKKDSGKLAIRPDHPRRRIEVNVCMPGGLRCVLYFKFGPVVLPLLVVENRPSPLLWLLYKPMGLYNSLYYRTSRDTVIGTLAVDGWAVTFGTARGGGLGGAAARPGPSSLYQM